MTIVGLEAPVAIEPVAAVRPREWSTRPRNGRASRPGASGPTATDGAVAQAPVTLNLTAVYPWVIGVWALGFLVQLTALLGHLLASGNSVVEPDPPHPVCAGALKHSPRELGLERGPGLPW